MTEQLSSPVYQHLLINHVPIIGTVMGLVGLGVAFVLRQRMAFLTPVPVDHPASASATEGMKTPRNALGQDAATTRTVEFIADNPGDWAMHCHMTHHVMNQMGHEIPNLIGVDPGDLDKQVRTENSVPMVGSVGPHGTITMGGMYTNVKIRADLGDLDPAKGEDFLYGRWFENPPGTEAMLATADELSRDGISKDQRADRG